MIALSITFWLLSLIADESLFRAIREQEPEFYIKMGKPDLIRIMWHPIVIIQVILLLLFPSPFETGSSLHRQLWVCRLLNMCFVIAVYIAVVY